MTTTQKHINELQERLKETDVDFTAIALQLQVMSEVEDLLDAHGMSRKNLADALGTSQSYVTQLFKVNKPLNFKMMAKLQTVFNKQFFIEARDDIARPVRARSGLKPEDILEKEPEDISFESYNYEDKAKTLPANSFAKATADESQQTA